MRTPLERLMARIVADEAGCWIFTGALRNGYGAVGVGGRTVYAHRYAYTQLVGEIPAGLVLDHLCRNRACCNPEHLEAVTQQENCLRGERAGQRVTECHNGHAYTVENTYTNPQGYRACRTCIKSRRAA